MCAVVRIWGGKKEGSLLKKEEEDIIYIYIYFFYRRPHIIYVLLNWCSRRIERCLLRKTILSPLVIENEWRDNNFLVKEGCVVNQCSGNSILKYPTPHSSFPTQAHAAYLAVKDFFDRCVNGINHRPDDSHQAHCKTLLWAGWTHVSWIHWIIYTSKLLIDNPVIQWHTPGLFEIIIIKEIYRQLSLELYSRREA